MKDRVAHLKYPTLPNVSQQFLQSVCSSVGREGPGLRSQSSNVARYRVSGHLLERTVNVDPDLCGFRVVDVMNHIVDVVNGTRCKMVPQGMLTSHGTNSSATSGRTLTIRDAPVLHITCIR